MRDLFYQCCGWILAEVDERLPMRTSMSPSDILSAVGLATDEKSRIACAESVRWLADNGYIRFDEYSLDVRANGEQYFRFHGVRATDKGLAALNKHVDFCGITHRIGDALRAELKDTAKAGRNAVVTELVGQLIGGIVKSFAS